MSKVVLTCEQCGKTVERWPSQVKGRVLGVFCSNTCLGSYRTEKLVGPLGANWRQGVQRDRSYQAVYAPWHPSKDRKGYAYLHRLIAEARLGRYLSSGEVVHHRDGNSENNHWDNLSVMTQSEHAGLHHESRSRSEKGRYA